MIMMCDISAIDCPFGSFVDEAAAIGDQNNLKVHVMHEDIFNSMHRI
jgi:ACT domain-containing protein